MKGVHFISVIKSKRNESNLQFVDTAFKLYTFTIQQCVKFPKRYTFYVSQAMADTATKILVEVKRGNSIYPTNAHEVQMRRNCFLNAYANTQGLISQINAATELFQIAGTVLTGWMELIQSELNLLRGIMKKDKARYKNICQPKSEDTNGETETTEQQNFYETHSISTAVWFLFGDVWLRSPNINSTTNFYNVNTTGSNNNANNSNGVCFGFCGRCSLSAVTKDQTK